MILKVKKDIPKTHITINDLIKKITSCELNDCQIVTIQNGYIRLASIVGHIIRFFPIYSVLVDLEQFDLTINSSVTNLKNNLKNLDEVYLVDQKDLYKLLNEKFIENDLLS